MLTSGDEPVPPMSFALARAMRTAILLRGPRDAVTAAFAALHRTPRFVE
jgi:hypothetical protein